MLAWNCVKSLLPIGAFACIGSLIFRRAYSRLVYSTCLYGAYPIGSYSILRLLPVWRLLLIGAFFFIELDPYWSPWPYLKTLIVNLCMYCYPAALRAVCQLERIDWSKNLRYISHETWQSSSENICYFFLMHFLTRNTVHI